VAETGLDLAKYVAAIKQAFRALCEVTPAIDEFLSKCQPVDSAPQGTGDLRVVAFLDTETPVTP
jgi:hypothetical protein